MVLGKGLVDADSVRHEMAGLLPLESSFAKPRLHLGYRRIESLCDSPLGPAGLEYTGHEFHYATASAEGPGESLFAATDSRGVDLGPVGLASGCVAGSFIHLIDRAS